MEPSFAESLKDDLNKMLCTRQINTFIKKHLRRKRQLITVRRRGGVEAGEGLFSEPQEGLVLNRFWVYRDQRVTLLDAKLNAGSTPSVHSDS